MGEDYFAKYRNYTSHTFGHENHVGEQGEKMAKTERVESFRNNIKFQCKRYFCAKSNLS